MILKVFFFLILFPFGCFADQFSLARIGYFAILGGPDISNETKSYQGPGTEFEFLYMKGEDRGFLVGVVTGEKVGAHYRGPSGPSRIDYNSKYLFNGLKLGVWQKDASGTMGQAILTYGKGKFDFYEDDAASGETTLTPNLLEFEARVKFPVFKQSDVNIDFYAGTRLNGLFVSDFEYKGIQFKGKEVSNLDAFLISFGIGASY